MYSDRWCPEQKKTVSAPVTFVVYSKLSTFYNEERFSVKIYLKDILQKQNSSRKAAKKNKKVNLYVYDYGHPNIRPDLEMRPFPYPVDNRSYTKKMNEKRQLLSSMIEILTLPYG